jgi:perosamine synthetase
MIPVAKPLIGKEEQQAVAEVLSSGMLAAGPRTQEFEERFAEFVGTNYAIATTSGTTALHLGLLSLGIKPGDEVIVPSFTFIASVNTILFCGATPVLCDVDPDTFTINPEKAAKRITPKTKAIMPVHLYGQPADLQPLQELAERHDLFLIGDAAQAHGAMYRGKKIGSFGTLECFSFYPTKNMTTGEGGMITTNDEDLYHLADSIRNHGREKTKWGYEHGRIGYNYRMTDLAAAIGIEQLKKLPTFNKKRQHNAAYFNSHLEHVQTPKVMDNVTHVYHQYTILYNQRDSLMKALQQHEIGYGIYYPKPVHNYHHLQQYGHKDLVISERLTQEVFSLPVHPALGHHDLEMITETVNEACQRHDT